MSDHWQVVKVTGIGLGEMWFDTVAEDLTREQAKAHAGGDDRYLAIPTPYDPSDEEMEAAGLHYEVDDFEREVVPQ